MESEKHLPYIVVWELHEKSEVVTDPNPTLSTKVTAAKSKWSSMLNMPFSTGNGLPRSSIDITRVLSSDNLSERGSSSSPPPTTAANGDTFSPKKSQSTSDIPSSSYDDEEEEIDYSKMNQKVDTSAYPVWSNQLSDCVKKCATEFDMTQYRSKSQIVINNVFLKEVTKIKLQYLTSNNPRCRFSRHWNNGYRNPYFHLIVVKCEDGEEYKNHVKPKLKNITDYMLEKEYNYLILYIQQPSKRFSFFKVFDRLKTEFSKDCVVKLEEKTLAEDFVKFDVPGKIREGVVNEFVRRTSNYDKEIRKCELNKNLPGWQFCHFFLMKEGLAFTLEHFGLFVNAHGMYQQLNAFVTSAPDSVRFSQFMSDVYSISPILDTTTVDYRQMMYENRISEFDFHNYVFARQVHLLFKLGNPDMVAELAAAYIPQMMNQLQDYLLPDTEVEEQEVSHDSISVNLEPKTIDETEDDSSEDKSVILLKLFPKRRRRWSDADIRKFLFARSWAYCAAINVVETCEKHGMALDKTSSLEYLFRRMGDLYLFIRFQLQIIGNVFGRSISNGRFAVEDVFDLGSLSPDNPLRGDPTMKTTISIIEQTRSPSADLSSKLHLLDFGSEYSVAKHLYDMVQTQTDFGTLYIEMSAAASSKFTIGKRGRFVDRLNSEMASIRFSEGDFEDALILLQPQVQRYEVDNWQILKLETQRKLAECERGIGRVEYYVKLCVELMGTEFYVKELKKYLPQLPCEVQTTAPNESLRVGVESANGRTEACVENGAPWKFSLIFYNNHLHDFYVDKVLIEFKEKVHEGVGKTLIVEAPGFTLNGEYQKLVVKHRMNAVGVFQVKRVELLCGQLRLSVPIEHNHPRTCLPQELLQKLPEGVVTIARTSHKKLALSSSTSIFGLQEKGDVKDSDSLSSYGDSQTSLYATYFDPGFLITAISGEGALEISFVQKACLIVDKEQVLYLRVKNPSDEEPLDNVQLALVPSESFLTVLSPTSGQLVIDVLKPLETKEYPIHVRAQRTTAGNCTVCSLACVIVEQNVKRVIELSFYEPFIYFYHTKVTPNYDIMMQVIIECTTPTSLDIVGYNLDPKAGVDLVQDFNAHNFKKKRSLLPEQALSFVFILSPKHTLLDFHKSILQISYESRGSDMILTSDIPITFSTITHKPYSISVASVGKMVLGELCLFRFDVLAPALEKKSTTSSSQYEEPKGMQSPSAVERRSTPIPPSIMCEVMGEDWLIVGKKKQLLEESNMSDSQDTSKRLWRFEIQVVPLVSGYTRFPYLQLEGVTPEMLSTHCASSDGQSMVNGSTIFVQPALGEVAGPLYPITFPALARPVGVEPLSLNPNNLSNIPYLDFDEEMSSLSESSSKTPLGGPGPDVMTFRDFLNIPLQDGNLTTARTVYNTGTYNMSTSRTMRRDTDTLSM